MALHLTAEAATISKELLAYLETFIHLTLSYDGWSSKGRDEIYTVHVTTPDPRKSYLVEGLVLTGSSTDAETIFDRLKDVISFYTQILLRTDGRSRLSSGLLPDGFQWWFRILLAMSRKHVPSLYQSGHGSSIAPTRVMGST